MSALRKALAELGRARTKAQRQAARRRLRRVMQESARDAIGWTGVSPCG